MKGPRTWLPVLLLLGATPGALGAVPIYSTFELQARSNIVDGYNLPANSSFNSKTPALNDAGTIAFSLVSVGGGNAGLFTGAAGTGSVVYTAPAERGLEDPGLNSTGQAVFDQFDIFSDGIFLYDPDSGLTTLAVAPATFSIATGAGITDGGAIGYRAAPFGGAQSWRRFEGGSETILAVEGGGIAFLFIPSTNAGGQLAGKVRLGDTSGSSPDELRVYSAPGTFDVVAVDDDGDPASPWVGFDNGVHLADDGRVAFVADLVGGGRGVFLSDGTTTVTIATEADPLVSDISFFTPAANASGLVAFRGTDGDGLDAVFVGDGTDLVRLVGEHDLVPVDLGTARIDQHDDSVTFGGGLAINAAGDVAFNASLTPADNNMIEWGSGMFIAYADGSGAAPPPVPDGALVGGTPLRIGKDDVVGDLVVTWDATTCPADEYNLFAGDLDEATAGTIHFAECGLGPAGSAAFTPPAGDLFFIVASENAAGVESGHGVDSDGQPRPSSGVGRCGIVEQSLEGTCP